MIPLFVLLLASLSAAAAPAPTSLKAEIAGLRPRLEAAAAPAARVAELEAFRERLKGVMAAPEFRRRGRADRQEWFGLEDSLRLMLDELKAPAPAELAGRCAEARARLLTEWTPGSGGGVQDDDTEEDDDLASEAARLAGLPEIGRRALEILGWACRT